MNNEEIIQGDSLNDTIAKAVKKKKKKSPPDNPYKEYDDTFYRTFDKKKK